MSSYSPFPTISVRDLFRRLVTETDDTLQHLLLIPDIILVGQFQSLFQIVDAQHMVFFLHHLLGQYTTAEQYRFERPEQLAQEQYTVDSLPAETQGALGAIYLRHDFAEKQQDKSKKYGDTDKLQPIG